MKRSTKRSVFYLSLVLLAMLAIPLIGQKAFAATFSWDCHSDNSCHRYDWIWLFPSLQKAAPVTLEPDGSIRNDEDPRDVVDVSRALPKVSGNGEILKYIASKDWNFKTAREIATCESSITPKAIGDNGWSIGVFQVNIPAHPKYDREKLFDYQYNVDAAYEIYLGRNSQSRNFSPWSTYTIPNAHDEHDGLTDVQRLERLGHCR